MAKAKRGYQSNKEFLAIFRRRREMLQRWLRSNFEFTIVDCPPSVALQVQVFLSVGDCFVVPAIRSFALVFVRWTVLQVLYWLGASPVRLGRWYARMRASRRHRPSARPRSEVEGGMPPR